MRFKLVNRRKDKRVMARVTRMKNPKNVTLTNTRGGIRM